jgi:hypothetical protein
MIKTVADSHFSTNFPLCDFSYLITHDNGAAAKANLFIDKKLTAEKKNVFRM